MTDDRLDKIETLLAHHERQLLDLHEVMTRQWGEIDRLNLLLMRAADQIRLMGGDDDKSREGLSVSELAALDKPPHY